MSKTFFIADTHFGGSRILLYENRPFEDVDEMDKMLIKNWNNVVEQDDTVYHLGDFCDNGKDKEYLSQLNGHIKLVKGNHDNSSNEFYRTCGFEEVYDCPILFNSFWMLSHEPLYINTNMPYANLFGHVHNSPLYKDFSSQHFCVSVERIDYTPIPFDKIVSQIQSA